MVILALVMNPYVRQDCFDERNPALTSGELSKMFTRVYKRIMQQEPDVFLLAAFDDYIQRIGRWSDSALQLDLWKTAAEMQVSLTAIRYMSGQPDKGIAHTT